MTLLRKTKAWAHDFIDEANNVAGSWGKKQAWAHDFIDEAYNVVGSWGGKKQAWAHDFIGEAYANNVAGSWGEKQACGHDFADEAIESESSNSRKAGIHWRRHRCHEEASSNGGVAVESIRPCTRVAKES